MRIRTIESPAWENFGNGIYGCYELGLLVIISEVVYSDSVQVDVSHGNDVICSVECDDFGWEIILECVEDGLNDFMDYIHSVSAEEYCSDVLGNNGNKVLGSFIERRLTD